MPLIFKNEADYDKIDQMDELELKNVRKAIEDNAPVIVSDKTKGIEIETEAVLSQRQREMVLAGGLLNYTREQN